MIHCVQHGDFQYKWLHNVLVVTYSGCWNVQAVHALHQTLAANWQAKSVQRWAMLTDASHWEGGTPEVLDAWWVFFEDAVAHGMCTVTDILPSHFHALLVQSLAERAARSVTYQRSENIQAAKLWLAQQGFDITQH